MLTKAARAARGGPKGSGQTQRIRNNRNSKTRVRARLDNQIGPGCLRARPVRACAAQCEQNVVLLA